LVTSTTHSLGTFEVDDDGAIDAGIHLQHGTDTINIGLTLQSATAAMLLQLPKVGQLSLTLSSSQQGWQVDAFERQVGDASASLLPQNEQLITGLEAEIATLSRALEGVRAQVFQLSTENTKLQATIEAQAEAEASLRLSLQNKSDSLADCEQQIEQLDLRQRQLGFIVDQRSSAFEELSRAHESLLQTRQQLDTDLKTNGALLDATREKHQDALRQLEESKRTTSAAQAAQQQLTTRVASLEQELNSRVDREDYQRLERELEKQKDLSVQLEQLKKREQQLKQHHQELERELSKQQDVGARLEQSKAVVQQLEHRQQELERERDARISAEMFEELQRHCATLKADAAKAQAAERSLSMSLKEAQSRALEMNRRMTETIDALNQALDKEKALTAQLTAEAAARPINATLEIEDSELLDLEWPLDQAKK
jgi:chromosome segregation ATPase